MRDYGLPVSIALHALALAGALIALPAAKSFAPAEESLPVEILTADQFAAITKGEKAAKRAETPAIKVDKVAEAKLEDDSASQVKREAVTVPPPPQPKKADPVPIPPTPQAKSDPKPKPVKPEPVKPEPVKEPVPAKPPEPPREADKPEPKAIAKSETAKLDEMALKAVQEDKPEPKQAEAKKTETKPEVKPADKPAEKEPVKLAAAPPSPQQPTTRVFDSAKISALLSKEAPARKARSDAKISATAALGTSRGDAPRLSLSERTAIVGAILNHVSPCWVQPSLAANAKDLTVLVNVDLNEDGTLAANPQVVKYSANPSGVAAANAAMRAIKRCVTEQSPLKLPPNLYASWKAIEINFDPSQMAGG
jgi:colicin import membrane protein